MGEQFKSVTYPDRILIITKKQQDERNRKNTPGPS